MQYELGILDRYLSGSEREAVIDRLKNNECWQAIDILEQSPKRREILLALADILEALVQICKLGGFSAEIAQLRQDGTRAGTPWMAWDVATFIGAMTYATTGRAFSLGERKTLHQDPHVRSILLS